MTRAEFEARLRSQRKTCKGPTVLSREARIVLYQQWRALQTDAAKQALIKGLASTLGMPTDLPSDPDQLFRSFSKLVDTRKGCPSAGRVISIRVVESGAGYRVGEKLCVVGGEGNCFLRVEREVSGKVKEVSVLSGGTLYRTGINKTTGWGDGCKVRITEIDHGHDFNDTVLAGPLDGEIHDYQCPRCGVQGRYRAPRFIEEEIHA